MAALGLDDVWSVRCGDEIFGVPREHVLAKARESALLLNVMGFLDDTEILAAATRRAFLDIDPGFGQMWQALGLAKMFTGHDAYVTIGENIGQSDCTIPDCGITWITTPQPVVLEQWPVRGGAVGPVGWGGGGGGDEPDLDGWTSRFLWQLSAPVAAAGVGPGW
jgi:hypothetical protein